MAMMRKGTALLSMSRSMGHDADVAFEIVDEKSGALVFHGRMSLDAFARLVTAQARMPVTGEWVAPERIGMRHEVERREIVFEDCFETREAREEAAREHVKKFEADGWVGSWRDLLNHHRRLTGRKYEVVFHRYVADDAGG